MVEQSTPKHVVILTTTTGGGHKAAAGAIEDSLIARYGSRVTVETVDVLKDYAPLPFDRTPEAYQIMQRMPPVWRSFYELGDGVRRSKLITATIALYAWKQADKLLNSGNFDVIISTYHFANAPMLEALDRCKSSIPFISVVTDLVTAPPVWFDSRIKLCVIPTEQVRPLALEGGVKPERIQCLGMPVSAKFQATTPAKRREAKAALGWSIDRPAVLVMSGADGVGPLEELATRLSSLNATIVVVTGKNHSLKEALQNQALPSNVQLYGYVDDMSRFMGVGDILVSKAGAATVMESLNSHLPIVFFAKLSGQEDGNVDYVIDAGAGFWAPKPTEVLKTVRSLVEDPAKLAATQKACAKIDQPKAGDNIARAVGQLLNIENDSR